MKKTGKLPNHFFSAVAPVIGNDLKQKYENPYYRENKFENEIKDNKIKADERNGSRENCQSPERFNSLNRFRNSLTPLESTTRKEISSNESKIFKYFPAKFCNCNRFALLTILSVILIGTLAAAITLILFYTTQPYASLNESCLTKQCDPSKLLSCVNGTCQCYDFYSQIYNKAVNGCETKSLFEKFLLLINAD